MRVTRKYPPQANKKPRKQEPLAEGIVPLDSRGRRNWSRISDDELVAYAQKFVEGDDIRSRKGLERTENRLYSVLVRRKLMDRLEFKGNERGWRYYNNDELVDFAQKFVDENKIGSRKGLERAYGALYAVLIRRKLLDGVNFKADKRAWSRYSDDGLVSYTQNFIKENGIQSRKGLASADSGLCRVLVRRKLIDKVQFETSERGNWRKYSDDELVDYARKFVEENDVESRKGLDRAYYGLYSTLVRRKLMDRLKFKADERAWRRYSDDELVDYARKFVEENDIETRRKLQKTYGALYSVLIKKKLLDGVKFKADERAWSRYSDDELVDYARNFVEENEIRSKKELERADNGLYFTLWRRKLLDRVFATQEQDAAAQGIQEIADAMDEFGGEGCD